jgi:hypothetical protein
MCPKLQIVSVCHPIFSFEAVIFLIDKGATAGSLEIDYFSNRDLQKKNLTKRY